MHFLTLTTLITLITTVTAHGVIVTPPPRTPGSAYATTCGTTLFNNQASDPAGPIQLLLQSSSTIPSPACNLWLCKGYQFGDNSQVQSYVRGETVPFVVDIRAVRIPRAVWEVGGLTKEGGRVATYRLCECFNR